MEHIGGIFISCRNVKKVKKGQKGQKGKNKETLLTEGFSVAIKGKSDLDIYEIQIEEN